MNHGINSYGNTKIYVPKLRHAKIFICILVNFGFANSLFLSKKKKKRRLLKFESHSYTPLLVKKNSSSYAYIHLLNNLEIIFYHCFNFSFVPEETHVKISL